MKSIWFGMAMAGTIRVVRKSFGLALVVAACGGTAWGFDPSAPEIDPGSALSALTLLGGGVLLLYDRYRRR